MKFHPNLPALGRAAIKDAIDRFERDLGPVIALRYSKDGHENSSKSGRRSGVDFIPLPGIESDVHIGTITSIRDDKMRIKDLTRADGQDLGNTYLSIKRIVSFVVLASTKQDDSRHHRVLVPTKPTKERRLPSRR